MLTLWCFDAFFGNGTLFIFCCGELKVLGTFLTEWDEGKVIAEKLLSTEESARMYAERLAKLADALGFDGWLVCTHLKIYVLYRCIRSF